MLTSLWSERWNDSNPMEQISLSRYNGDWQDWCWMELSEDLLDKAEKEGLDGLP